MPGVLITEALAQTGAVAMLNSEENKGKIALFAGIDKAINSRFSRTLTNRTFYFSYFNFQH
jgi:3-hydroxyacyl-[acyl-carrier-protein] dehydratase